MYKKIVCMVVVLYMSACMGEDFIDAYDDDSPSRRIHDGTAVNFQDYPFAVYLGLFFYSLPTEYNECTGAIISNNLIITSAHCTTIFDPITNTLEKASNETIIQVGGGHSQDYGPTAQYATLREVIVHPNYDNGWAFDLSLIRTNDKLTKPEGKGSAIAVGSFEDLPEVRSQTTLKIVGYGMRNISDRAEHRPLQIGPMQRAATDECKTNLKFNLPPPDFRYICLFHSSIQSLGGDSGAPLLANDKLAGVILGGVEPTYRDYSINPKFQRMVLAESVSYYKEWIEGVIRTTN